jgi:glycosyltransferase involved in cell wall biosynthesis
MSPSILWLSRTIPLPQNAGDRIYTGHLVEALARAGGKVTYLGLANPDEPMGPLSQLSKDVEWHQVPGPPNSIRQAALSKLPLVSARFATPAFRASVRRMLSSRSYDAIVLDQYAMAWAISELKRFNTKSSAIIHVAHDFETEVTREIARSYRGNFLRKAALIQNSWKTQRSELALALKCDGIVTLTDHDSEAFKRLCPRSSMLVLPPGYSGFKRQGRNLKADLPRRVVILGSFRWIAKQMNLENFLRVASRVFTEAQVECCVVGSVPQQALARWQVEFPNVKFLGFVDNVQDVFDSARVGLVVESTGGGFKLKALDYVFGRLPLAGISESLRGLPRNIIRNSILANDAFSLAKAVVEAIDDVDRLNRMQDQAFGAALGHFDWEQNGRALLAFLEQVRRNKLNLGASNVSPEPFANPLAMTRF